MAKPGNTQGKVRTKNLMGAKGRKAELPINTEDSNAAGDKQAMMLHYGVMALAAVATIVMLLWATVMATAAVAVQPPNYTSLVFATLAIAASFFVGRGILWLAFIGPSMLAVKNKAWSSEEQICRKALAWGRLFPNGGSMAAFLLVQSLVSRGEFDEAMKVGEAQWERSSSKPEVDENVGPICSALALAYQMKGDSKQCVIWNERAIASFSKSLDAFANRKTFFAKIAGARGQAVTGNLSMQLSVAYFNNGMAYFNQMNYRQAKQNYQKAMEHASQSPDFPEKADMMKACKEQMGRLKHS